MMNPSLIETIGAGLFAVALLHTFTAPVIGKLAHRWPAHAGLFHLLGEVEVVFGFWALILAATMLVIEGSPATTGYLDSLSYTEPLFVFAVMVIAGSRPILWLTRQVVQRFARLLPLAPGPAYCFATLSLLPLMGSLITEPAAMTLAAMMLYPVVGERGIPVWCRYAILGVLFVNVSIGGVLSSFAAPPVLMVANRWDWNSAFMLTHFGWKAAIAVVVNAAAVTALCARHLAVADVSGQAGSGGNHGGLADDGLPTPPAWLVLMHLLFLGAVVLFAHHPPVFLGLTLFFLGFTHAYQRYQSPLILRQSLLVAFFLAGLVVLGGQQKWWLQPLIAGMDSNALYFGATALTAITDNAALTYLGSMVDGLSDTAKYLLVAGAVTGGGLTVIANAPNPAGFSILKDAFPDQAIHPLGLLMAACLPTLVAIAAFRLFP